MHEADLAPVNPFRDKLAKNPIELIGSKMEPSAGHGLEIDEREPDELGAVAGLCYLPPPVG